ncbi:MAG: ROK family protein [Rikenellaceae bacterium]|nr:ROK family protein [Rikenellaceae bacterium]MCL2691914.1 ROK family protein [Rikenellaceae bacterium]
MRKLAAGIDIGGTNTALGLVDRDGRTVATACMSTTDHPVLDDYINMLCTTVGRLLAEAGTDAEFAGIGIGAPSANYYNGTIENAANLPWRGVIPIVERIKARFAGVPVVVTNDANAAAIGEMVYGGARGMRDFMLVTLGTGVGSGFVAGGRLIYGHDSFAGELGHIIVMPGGRDCGCGRRGCLETYASAVGIRRTVHELIGNEIMPSVLRSVPFSELTAKMISEAAEEGDPLALAAFEETGEMLGIALANAVAITSPEAIFLFGGLAHAGELIFEPTRRYMEENMLFLYKDKVKLLPSGIDEGRAAILGASALVWDSVNG